MDITLTLKYLNTSIQQNIIKHKNEGASEF